MVRAPSFALERNRPPDAPLQRRPLAEGKERVTNSIPQSRVRRDAKSSASLVHAAIGYDDVVAGRAGRIRSRDTSKLRQNLTHVICSAAGGKLQTRRRTVE